MSGTVKLIIIGAMTAIASGATVVNLDVTLTDASGNVQRAQIPASSITPAADGTFSVEQDFNNVGSGSFTGTVQSTDITGAGVAPAISFSGTAQNLQPVPTAVTVSLA